ncbi:hypothetical protein QFC21_004873 [Naganishia friedmannii]|uniref:Uncharacterized protein n=1 Tax=Naganishia friedmannii TaxID=89922 RepID=A0ACC2VDG7_9TREE|nr:hypothetical protein QFC21_004873 [Naganishia friedmannii]
MSRSTSQREPNQGYQGQGYSDSPNTGYGNNNAGYGNGGNGYNQGFSEAPYATTPPKKKRNKWLWIGLPLLLLAIILGAVLGGVLGTRGGSKSSDPSTSSGSSNSGATSAKKAAATSVAGGVGSTATGANGQVYLAVSTDSYFLPVYATGTATSGYVAPTIKPTASAAAAWPADPSPPSTSSIRDHPRLIAPKYKWDALNSGLIAKDPYFTYWNSTIVANATNTLNDPVVPYTEDGGLSGSGVLDPAREIKMKVKNWAYAYRVTNDTKYANRVKAELWSAAGNDSENAFGTDNSRWNPAHFLDLAEFSSAFAIGYDWLYDFWTEDERTALRWSILNLGLEYGYDALVNKNSTFWWTGGSSEINGNWNCVCNGGLIMASLAILGDDTTGRAQAVLDAAIPNAKANCMQAVHPDGTWAETANYWYFGTTGAAEMISALRTAYGSDQGLIDSNPAWNLTSVYHMHVQGMTSLFNYGDHGPNKYSATANSLMLWADVFDEPRYALYQRDHYDSSEPWSMFWYNPSYNGAWWDGMPLDGDFSNWNDEWAAMRSSWTDNNGVYAAMKSGYLQGHQTHGDLDIGDFVIDALGQRWAGELGSGQYLSDDYFASEAQNAIRWHYYRKATEGQNTILLNKLNQNVGANVTSNFGTTGDIQGAAPSYTAPSGSSAFFTTDMTNAYNGTSIKRGLRLINSRRQILLQDDITNANGEVMWNMHTNATVKADGATATLTLGGQTLIAKIVQGPSGAAFGTRQPVRFASDPALPSGDLNQDQANPGVTVLTITLAEGGTTSLQVLFSPQYPSSAKVNLVDNVPNVAINEWTPTSHNA